MPSLLGFLSIGICVAALAFSIPDEQIRRPIWIFIFLVLATCAKFCWGHPRSPKKPVEWLKYIGLAIAIGLFLVVTDMLFYGVSSAHVVLDVALSVFGSIVAISGLVRSLVATKEK